MENRNHKFKRFGFGILIAFLMALALGATVRGAHANAAGDSLDALFGPAPGAFEPLDPKEFPDVWEDADFEDAQPVLTGVSVSRAAAPRVRALPFEEPVEEGVPVATNQGFCRGTARLEDKVLRGALRAVTIDGLDARATELGVRLRAAPRKRVLECMDREVQSIAHATRVDCLGLAAEEANGTSFIERFRSEIQIAFDRCYDVRNLTDKQVQGALEELLSAE